MAPIKRLPDMKAGATFLLPIYQQAADGSIEPLGDATVASQVRDVNGKLIAELTFIPKGDGSFDGHLQPVSPSTASWPIGDLYCDIVVTKAGIVLPSETFIIPIVRGQTHA
jgi:hypothetical protein